MCMILIPSAPAAHVLVAMKERELRDEAERPNIFLAYTLTFVDRVSFGPLLLATIVND